MKKQKKARPRSNDRVDRIAKQKIFKTYIKEMEEKTEKFTSSEKSNINFHLFQEISNKNLVRDSIFNLAYFYDANFTGNKDFMHVPNISNILDNILHYPIMLSTQKDEYGNDEILGTTTVKMENNKSISDNPYFPTENEDVLSITGILTKSNAVDKEGNKIKGLGRELFKSAIKGAYTINKERKIRLVCEVDCRNKNSLYSVAKAVGELQQENMNVQMFLTGYYEIYDSNKMLSEAPTFVLEIDLDNEKELNNNNFNFDYTNCQSTNLYSNLSKVICANTKECRKYMNIINDKRVIYHSVKPINALNITLDVGNTADGNERVPVLNTIQLEPANRIDL